MNIKKRIDEIYEELITFRRDLHMHPELGFEEYRTSKKITQFLDNINVDYQDNIAKTGVVGIINGKANKNNKTVALRADIDALPIQEKTNLEYKSVIDGKMHACGHDMHTTILLGTAKILKEMESEIDGNIKFLFQPAEETDGGALPMINEGVLENPKVDFVLGLHVMPYLNTGEIELKHGKLNASSDHIKITIKGESGHGAYPDQSVDSILIASHTIIALQSLVSRNISPLNSVVLSFGQINGGIRDNVIADTVNFSGTLRTLDLETRKFAKNKIKKIAEYQAKSFGASAVVEFNPGYEPLINNNEVVDIIQAEAIKLDEITNTHFKDAPSLGVEDFSYFSNRVKGAFFHLGCGKFSNSVNSPLHSDTFEADEECIKLGILLEVNTTLKLLNCSQ